MAEVAKQSHGAEAQLAAALSAFGAFVAVLDAKGCVRAVSPRLAHLIDLDSAALVGAPASRWLSLAPDVLASGRGRVVLMCGPTGRPRSAEIEIAPMVVGDRGTLRVCKFRLHPPADHNLVGGGGPAPAARREKVVGGQLQLIRLSDVADASVLQDDKSAQRAQAIARSVIKKALSPGDLMREGADGIFLICFETKDVAHARTKAQLLCDEIRQRLLGEERTAFEIVSQVEEIEFSDEPRHSQEDVFAQISQRLSRARESFRQRAALSAEAVLRAVDVELKPVFNRQLASSKMVMAQLSSNAAYLLAQVPGGETQQDIAFHIDCLLLSLAVERLYALAEPTRLLIVPVSYATLDHSRLRARYLELLRGVDDSLRGSVVLELHSLPETIVDLQLEMVSARLAGLVGRKMLRLPSSPTAINVRRHGISLVSVQAFAPERVELCGLGRHPLTKLSDSLHKLGCALLIRDVGDAGSVSWFVNLGADYLHGPGVALAAR